MTKKIKSLLAIMMALVMILSVGFGSEKAFAYAIANQGKITVNKTIKDKKYAIYKIFDLTYTGEDENKNVSYTIAEDWKDFFENGAGKSYIVNDNTGELNPITVDGKVKYINITEANIKDFAKAAQSQLSKMNKTEVKTAQGETLVFENLELGYYMVSPEGATEPTGEKHGSIVSLTSTLPEVTVNSKGKYPTITKKVDKKSEDYSKPVKFTLESKIPDTTGYDKYEFFVTDTLSKGLELDTDTIKVKIGDKQEQTVGIEKSANYYYEKSAGTDGSTVLKIFFNMKELQEDVNKKLEITYQAKIGKDALVGNTGNPNEVELEYSNDPKNNDSKEKTPKVTVKVYTGKIKLIKHEKDNEGKKLQNAEFVLYKKEGGNKVKYYKLNESSDKKEVIWVDDINHATVVYTDFEGKAEFKGLAAGTFFLKETKAPDGYNLLTTDTEVTLTDDDSSTSTLKMEAESKIANSSGIALPGTGGMGTTLFAVLGGAIILIALYSLAKGKVKKERN
ncbi:SpaH/EbpB family LPXTG-anchored major pilin [Peptoniphilus indolicus]|uniref:Large exoprotein involved in heme utilization or adhesion n=2 Tax=Peptoniphilus indolicus TaxID=33030 RepID=G4D3F0_9FIRM|nr:SpaH/EbpB family LPXTG-anchored major pilin [Peptoniphilus indolicus]EGY79951.1 large exoprotein involved in heme utilization or adhesion [Peptoniphilus indolicus ATCC 29427]SUB75619.1 T6 antigen [Peptoniphilus indolicus]SUB94779.1 T6 antigen [Peptoniphilus indolicus]